MKPAIRVLLLGALDRRQVLVELLQACLAEVVPVDDRSTLRHLLQTRPVPQVVLTEETLPGGDWCDVLEDVAQSGVPAEVVLCTEHAGNGGLWVDALERGVYDLLVAPYRAEEVRRIVELAAAKSRSRNRGPVF